MTPNIDLSATWAAVTVGVSLNPKNGVSLQALQGGQIGVGGIVGPQANVLGSKFGKIGTLDYGLSYDKTSGGFFGAKGEVNVGVLGLGELDGQVKFGKAFGSTVQVGYATQAYRDYVANQRDRAAEDILRDLLTGC